MVLGNGVNFQKISTAHKLLLGAVVAIGGLAALCAVIYYFPTSSNQGYQPVQPIPFSHRIHAGENKIDCKYCHVGATRARHASVPAMNVCMNCHLVVKTDSPHIQKLQQLYREGKPIEWVRIHELPDFALFNHKPHVLHGISCETCHGDVKRMDRVVQAKPLTMGWCLDCHRGETTPKAVLAKIESNPAAKSPDLAPGHVAQTNCTTCHQ